MVFSYTLRCMRFLEYMGFVLAVFPLKFGFIIVQISLNFPLTKRYMKWINLLMVRKEYRGALKTFSIYVVGSTAAQRISQ